MHTHTADEWEALRSLAALASVYIRNTRRLTQAQLAVELHTSQQVISSVEARSKAPMRVRWALIDLAPDLDAGDLRARLPMKAEGLSIDHTPGSNGVDKMELRLKAQRAAQYIRRRDGISQAELAAICGTTQPIISLIEHGRPRAPFRVLHMLIAAAGLIELQNHERTA